MNPLADFIEALGITSVWTYLALFLVVSLLMLWRLEALLQHGLEGTALGTLVMPYCSGLGNLLFVGIALAKKLPAQEILTNCVVNNVTNLTLVLGLPTLIWGLALAAPKKKSGSAAGAKGRKTKAGAGGGDTEHQLTRLSLLLTLAAVVFFSGVTWALAADGRLDTYDGAALIGLFLFWQCFQVFDVLKHNVRQRHAFGLMFYLDLSLVVAAAYGQYVSIDWLVDWLGHQKGEFINAAHLGWLSGWLMVVPNALLAFFYAARRRADIAFASQVGDGHICIPLCLGLAAVFKPMKIPAFFETGLMLLASAAIVHAVCVWFANGLPRWMGWVLVGAYAVFLAVGL